MPALQDSFLESFLIWEFQLRFSSIVTPRTTNYIEGYQENFLSVDEISGLNIMLGTLTFSQVNGRGVASYGSMEKNINIMEHQEQYFQKYLVH